MADSGVSLFRAYLPLSLQQLGLFAGLAHRQTFVNNYVVYIMAESGYTIETQCVKEYITSAKPTIKLHKNELKHNLLQTAIDTYNTTIMPTYKFWFDYRTKGGKEPHALSKMVKAVHLDLQNSLRTAKCTLHDFLSYTYVKNYDQTKWPSNDTPDAEDADWFYEFEGLMESFMESLALPSKLFNEAASMHDDFTHEFHDSLEHLTVSTRQSMSFCERIKDKIDSLADNEIERLFEHKDPVTVQLIAQLLENYPLSFDDKDDKLLTLIPRLEPPSFYNVAEIYSIVEAIELGVGRDTEFHYKMFSWLGQYVAVMLRTLVESCKLLRNRPMMRRMQAWIFQDQVPEDASFKEFKEAVVTRKRAPDFEKATADFELQSGDTLGGIHLHETHPIPDNYHVVYSRHDPNGVGVPHATVTSRHSSWYIKKNVLDRNINLFTLRKHFDTPGSIDNDTAITNMSVRENKGYSELDLVHLDVVYFGTKASLLRNDSQYRFYDAIGCRYMHLPFIIGRCNVDNVKRLLDLFERFQCGQYSSDSVHNDASPPTTSGIGSNALRNNPLFSQRGFAEETECVSLPKLVRACITKRFTFIKPPISPVGGCKSQTKRKVRRRVLVSRPHNH